MKVEKGKIFVGTECKCTSYPTLAGTYFGITFEKEKLGTGIFIKVGEDKYLKLEDIKDVKYSKLAIRKLKQYSTEVKRVGDLYIGNIKPYYASENSKQKINLEDISYKDNQQTL